MCVFVVCLWSRTKLCSILWKSLLSNSESILIEILSMPHTLCPSTMRPYTIQSFNLLFAKEQFASPECE